MTDAYTITRYVVASSRETAGRNRYGPLVSFENEAAAWREMASKPRLYPVDAGFLVRRVQVSVTDCEPPMTEEKHEEAFSADAESSY